MPHRRSSDRSRRSRPAVQAESLQEPQPSFGAWTTAGGTWFRVWAPAAAAVDLVLGEDGEETVPLEPEADGVFRTFVAGVSAGTLYRYRLDGEGPYPDPASRWQPDGPHGPSQVIDPNRFHWNDDGWTGIGLGELVVYELHVGTFTARGNFLGVQQQLPYLAELGITAIELMPVADFPGGRNWGYDGVALYAPAHCYGPPDDLRELVDAAHRLGIAVLLDVVYNHLGPDGAYLGRFAPPYFSDRHQTPWGAAINLDGPGSAVVRAFLIDNALHWLREYHLDGLRLDATHALIDDGPRHFLQELSEGVRASVKGRRILLIAEDERNLARIAVPVADGGWGFDAIWADDFHHEARRALAGDCEGYYCDFTGSIADLATTVRQGWFFCGQHSEHLGRPRGTDPLPLAPSQLVICLQNHDQIGNRALGERLHHEIDLAAFRAATALLLCAPETPLLFMGQEWAASSPFLYFTDHAPGLGELVTEGRRREFRHFSAFADPAVRERIPDPQDVETFRRSRLFWDEREREPHAGMLRLYRELLRLRASEPALKKARRDRFTVLDLDESTLLLQRHAPNGDGLALVVRLKGSGATRLAAAPGGELAARWTPLLHTEEPRFVSDPQPPQVEGDEIHFARPAAILFRTPR